MRVQELQKGSLPISNPAPGKECAAASGRRTDIRATCLLAAHTPLLVVATLPPRAAIWRVGVLLADSGLLSALNAVVVDGDTPRKPKLCS